jgi:uncharacterized protein with PIN domain
MERQAVELQEKLTGLLREAAEVSVAPDRLNGTIRGVPHYSVIELRAHELGRQLSRAIQQRHMAAVVDHQVGRARCPACGAESELEPAERRAASIDGPLGLPELKGYCRRCRRSFFPPAGAAGL